MPHPDMDHSPTYIAGVVKRLAKKRYRPPLPIRTAVRKLSAKAAAKYPQLDAHTLEDVDEFLLESNYPGWRKEELKLVSLKTMDSDYLWTEAVKSFIKDEQYTDYKHARTINAREDDWKIRFGPGLKHVEKILLKNCNYIKQVPHEKRWEFIASRLVQEGAPVTWTDHTSFEQVFTPEFVEALIMPFYEHVLAHVPWGAKFLADYRRVVLPRNGHTLKSKYCVVSGVHAEMSGEMDTSLKNCLGNRFGDLFANAVSCEIRQVLDVMFITLFDDATFAEWLARSTPADDMGVEGVLTTQHAGVYEGDDGITQSAQPTDAKAFSRLGFDVKMARGATLEDGDFCCIDGTIDGKYMTTNPLKILGHLGWMGRLYIPRKKIRVLEVLRARALSTVYTYPNSPIIAAYCHWIMRATAHLDMRNFADRHRELGSWTVGWLEKAIGSSKALRPRVPVSEELREVVESRYGIRTDHQIEIERYFDAQNSMTFIDCPILSLYWPDSWVDYAARYDAGSNVKQPTQPFVPIKYDNLPKGLRNRLLAMGLDMSCQ